MPRKRTPAAGSGAPRDIAREHFEQGVALLEKHPIFRPLWLHAHILRYAGNLCPADGWAVVTSDGEVHVHPTRRAAPEEWAYVMAHCLLHLGFDHVRARPQPREWNAACDLFVARFLSALKFGRAPEDLLYRDEPPATTEERVYELFCERGLPDPPLAGGTAGLHAGDIVVRQRISPWRQTRWADVLGEGLVAAVNSAVEVAAGLTPSLGSSQRMQTPAQRARSWFISSYPLLGSLAASFRIVEDAEVCRRMEISVAAVDVESREIFFNPQAVLTEHECRFVMAHELLHVGLRHDARRQGRDPYLWNVACDYVINGWLLEMHVGDMPRIGALHDPELKGESAESIYDRIVTDLRRYRKLATLRGVGLSDILEPRTPDWWRLGDGVALDGFYRDCLSQGLTYHQDQGRGFLPAGLIEEIEALSQPPIPWDVELARWFDHYFPPVEKVRSYARPSRHQSSTPDIPRPRWVPPPNWEDGRTFGVLLDTSGSMDRKLLAKTLGAIASYSLSRDVPAARVVFCDAAAYDQGYMPPDAIAETVKVRGRGGTVLQPGIDLLERAEDFPEDGPLLIITDGKCDVLRVRREHAYLMPAGRSLPFVPKGPVFYIA